MSRAGQHRIPGVRLLPVSIGAMIGLLLLKSIGLVQAATAPPAPAAQEAAMPPALPPAPNVAKPSRPAASTDTAPSVSDAERKLLLDLRQRREALDARAAALDARSAMLDATERKLAARVAELDQLQNRLEGLEQQRRMHESANWSGLVRIYEAMKPRDAATIFDALDMQVLLPVLDRMQDRKAAPILAAMQPDRARLATQMLAELRLRETDPNAKGP